MAKTLLYQYQRRISLYLFLPGLLISINSLAVTGNPKTDFAAYDSLKTVLRDVEKDTARFDILRNYFWRYYNSDFERAKPVGQWAYDEIKNSTHLKALSDGLDIKGCLLESEQEYDSAYHVFQKALDISKKIGYNTRIGWSYYHLGIIKEIKGEADSAFFYYKILINFNKNVGFHESVCDMYLVTANLFQTLGETDSALLFYNHALDYSRQTKLVNKEIYMLFNLAWFYGNLNNYSKKVENLNAALNLAEKSNDTTAIFKVYINIANIFFTQKHNYDLALLYYSKALDICTVDNMLQIAALNNDIANVYIAKGDDSLALKHALTALSLASSVKQKHQISEAHKTLGEIYSMQGNLIKAIENYTICFTTGCDECPQIKFHNALIKMADAYLKLEDRNKALEYYTRSLQLANDFNSPADRALSLFKLGNYYRLADNSQAENFYLKAYQFAGTSDDLAIQKEVSDTLAAFYKNRKNYKLAFEYQSIARVLSDSIVKIEQQATLAEWETRFEFEKLKSDNESNEQLSDIEIARQKTYRNSALLVSILLLILGWVFWQSYKRKKKDYSILQQQKKEIENISKELHQSDATKLRFFANLSHEFRTPLTLILNPAKKLLEASGINGESEKQLQHIYTNAQKLHDLTNQIMDLQKLDAGKLQLNLEKTDIIAYCLGICSSFESLCDKKKNKIVFSGIHSHVLAAFDKDKTGKILINLLSNALKFCDEGSTIEISTKFTDKLFTLTVADKGIGIEKDQIEQIFKRYYQVSSEKQAEGTGIGLAYVKELVGFMKGDVQIDSRVSEGTTIEVSIPFDEIEIIDSTPVSRIIPELGKKSSPREFNAAEYLNENEKSILIVEDNDELRSFIADIFKSDFNIHLAKDGKEGVQVAMRHTPDIIISDVMMPKMNGFELCTFIKGDEHTSHIPVLLLTAKDTAQSSLEGFHSGADDYILKPFENELLNLKVRNILNTKAALSRQYNSELNILPNAGSYSDIDKKFMQKCIQSIEKNIGNSEFSVDALASELGFSRSNLYRKIISLTPFNPAELIRNIRIQYAAKLLKTSDIRVNEVAFKVGYDNAAKFSQAFKKYHGVLPSEIQKAI